MTSSPRNKMKKKEEKKRCRKFDALALILARSNLISINGLIVAVASEVEEDERGGERRHRNMVGRSNNLLW